MLEEIAKTQKSPEDKQRTAVKSGAHCGISVECRWHSVALGEGRNNSRDAAVVSAI